jgi:iron complex transport system substrate-binding protein
MKVCSFLPAATIMIQEMNLEDLLFGVTFECPSEKPKVVRSVLEGNHYSSAEIDRIVSQAKAQGKSLYYIEEELLQDIAPDIIFTQDVCDVCQIDTACVQRSVYKLNKQPLLIPLFPKNLDDVFDNAVTIATAMGKEECAYKLLVSLKKRTENVIDTLRANKAPLRRVMLMEWMDPPYNCGHWIPYQIAQAGAVDMLSNPSGYSIKIDWDKIVLYDPEVLVIAPCGLEIERAEKEIVVLERLPGWNNLKAVKNSEVYFADSNLFTCPSTKLIDGTETLASLFHPSLFNDLREKHRNSFKKNSPRPIAKT